MEPSIKLGKHVISEDSECFVIAEIGQNHCGDIEIAKRLIDEAAKAGAHAVKLQKRDNKTLFTKAAYDKPYDNDNSFGATYGEHREKLEFNQQQYMQLKFHAENLGLVFFATPFDIPSADFLEQIGVPAYKIASALVTDIPLIEHVARKGKPVFLSTGASTQEDVDRAYAVLRSHNVPVCLMHCIAAYPMMNYKEANLTAIPLMKLDYDDAVIGFSSHESGIMLPIAAYLWGARVVEKHFTLNRAMKGGDQKFSLEPAGLTKMVRDLRRIKDAISGDGEKVIHPSELDAKRKLGKGIYAKVTIPRGTIITPDMIAFKSPSTEMPPYMVDQVLGGMALEVILEDSPILPAMLSIKGKEHWTVNWGDWIGK
jgi:sialic acid synthase